MRSSLSNGSAIQRQPVCLGHCDFCDSHFRLPVHATPPGSASPDLTFICRRRAVLLDMSCASKMLRFLLHTRLLSALSSSIDSRRLDTQHPHHQPVAVPAPFDSHSSSTASGPDSARDDRLAVMQDNLLLLQDLLNQASLAEEEVRWL